MAEMVTRCPECSTSFRITQAQIQKARGAVRCGSCLHIFNAQKHLIEGKPVTKKRAAGKAAAKPVVVAPQQEHLDIDTPAASDAPGEATQIKANPTKPQISSATVSGLRFDQEQIDRESEIHDDQLISDNMHKSEEDDELFFIDEQRSGHSLFDRKIDDTKEEFIDETDESWAENLLDDDTDEHPATGDTRSTFDNPLSIVGNDTQPEIKQELPTSTPSTYSGADFEAEFGHSADSRESPEDSLSAHDETESSPPLETPGKTKATPQPKFHLTEPAKDQEYSERLTAFDADRSAMLFNIDPEPVEMASAHSRHRKQRLLWGGGTLLACLLLIGQVAWLQFDRLSRVEPYRDYYRIACDLLGCTLPALSDGKRIRTFNLVVRNHPSQAGALVVDAIVLNGAPFTQAYPDLQLTFTDINNKPVASRVFTPAEYLKGELAGSKIMPKNQPIHLSLELVDPGETAVNYRLDIR